MGKFMRPTEFEYVMNLIFLPVLLWAGYKVVNCLAEVKPQTKYKVIMVVAVMFAVSMIMFVGDLVNLPPTLIGVIVAVQFCCRGSRWQRFAVAMIFCTEAFAISTLIDSYIQIVTELTVVLRALFWLGLWILMRRKRPPREYHLSDSTWKLISLMTVTPLGMVLSIVLLQSSSSITVSGAILSNITMLILATGTLVILMQMIPVLAAKENLEEKNRMYEMNRVYYENLERQQQEIRILRHDMANHLQTLAALSEAERISYIEKLTGTFAMAQSVRYCENPVVNGVLNAKQNLIAQAGISFQAQVQVPANLPVEAVDLCALVGNGMDNAIEACQKINQEINQENPFIRLTIRVDKGIFAMEIVNSCVAEVTLSGKGRGELPKTTKDASRGHGYGLRSMKEIAERYGGQIELSVSTEEGKFTLFLWLPLEQD